VRRKTVGIIAASTAVAGLAIAGIRGCGPEVQPPEPAAIVLSEGYHAPATYGSSRQIPSGGAVETTPNEGAVLEFPTADTRVSLPGGTQIHVPAASGGKIVVDAPSPKKKGGSVDLTVKNASTIRLPADTRVTHADGGSTTLKDAGDVELKPGETARLPGGTQALDIPAGADATVTISGGYVGAKLPADASADVPGACKIPLPEGVVVKPVTGRAIPGPPPSTTGPTPASAMTPTQLYNRVDAIPADEVFRENRVCIDLMTQAYRANPAVYDRDPQFWYRLGRLYSSVGMTREFDVGDLNVRRPTLVQARGCFNRASELLTAARRPTSSLPTLGRWNFDEVLRFSDNDLRALGYTPQQMSAMRPPNLRGP
jgi:hypothetical protein